MVAFSMALSRLLLLLVLCSVAFCARLEKPQLGDKKKLGFFPPSCNRIECPTYEVVAQGNGYEIRRYESTAWTSTQPMEDISLVNATRTAFFLLFDYIQGKNGYGQKIEMTAPVIAEVLPSDGPFCASSFVVSFYLPKINQADPPPADNLRTRRWAPRHVAVRQFSGFVSDDAVGEQAATLYDSLAGTEWAAAVDRARAADPAAASYTVAQYNSPFEFSGRVNEIWLLLELPKEKLPSSLSLSL
ncbi:SOUL heme-binding family protein [Wolffia australiana]